jgi:hypothetical protein
MPDHGELLDQVLLNEADIDLAANQYERASSLLEESKLALQKSHPDARDDAWRYAVWDSVNAQLLASKGETARAAATLAKAQSVLVNRFGVNGFYCTIAKRRMALIAHAKRASTLSAAD